MTNRVICRRYLLMTKIGMKSNGAASHSSTMKHRRLLSAAAVLLVCCLAFVGAVGAAEIELRISNPGSDTVSTTFTIDGKLSTATSLDGILNNHVTEKGAGALLNDGDVVVLPKGTIYMAESQGSINCIPGNISIKGAGEDKTTLVLNSKGWKAQLWLYNRYSESYNTGIIYKFNISDLTIKSSTQNTRSDHSAICISDYNTEVNVENVTIEGFTCSAFDLFVGGDASDGSFYPTDKTLTTTINLKNVDVKTENTGIVLRSEVLPKYRGANTEEYSTVWEIARSSCSFTFDENTVFSGDTSGKTVYNSNGQAVTYKLRDESIPFMQNVFINNHDITLDSAVAKIGETYYGSLKDAVEKATASNEINLLKDITLTETLEIGKMITINGKKSDDTGNYKITGPESSEILKTSGNGVTIDIKNIHLETKSSGIVGDVGEGDKIDIHDGVTSNVNIPNEHLIEGCECVENDGGYYNVQFKKFTVQFDSKGGTTISEQTISFGETVLKPENPTKEGFTFSKWMNGEEEWDFEIGVTTPLILNATWTENPIVPTPTTSGGGGEGGYLSFPRTTVNGGLVDFGSSKVIKALMLPEGSSGSVVLKVDTIEKWPKELETEYTFDISVEKLGEGMAYIHFEIPESTLESLGITSADICAYHLVDDVWVKLITTYEVKDGTVFYEAATDSFSPFKLVIEEGAAEPKAEETEPVIPPTEEPENKPEDIAPPLDPPVQPTEPESPSPILAVLAGLGAAAVLRRK